MAIEAGARRLQAWHRSGLAMARRTFGPARDLAHRFSAIDVRPQLARFTTAPPTLSLPFSHDEREVLALLLLPVLLVASTIAAHQSMRFLKGDLPSIARPDLEIASLRPADEATARPARPTPASAREVSPDAAALASPPPASLAPVPPAATPSATRESQTAFLVPPPDASSMRPVAPDAIPSREADTGKTLSTSGICTVEQSRHRAAIPVSLEPVPAGGEAFGRRLAQVAEAQVGSFVVYNDAYRSIRYPMGDVPGFFGVCTDVVIRAYRALGFDLQALVHKARSGRGDTNIDHRRTEVLRRFFAAEGESLPVTAFPEDYRPGDIVTYYRPQNRRSRAHIAIVSNVVAPSGRPMIVHNRGWGPQIEDALFVDEITGHYRYSGPSRIKEAGKDALETAPGAPLLPASFSPQTRDPSLRAE